MKCDIGKIKQCGGMDGQSDEWKQVDSRLMPRSVRLRWRPLADCSVARGWPILDRASIGDSGGGWLPSIDRLPRLELRNWGQREEGRSEAPRWSRFSFSRQIVAKARLQADKKHVRVFGSRLSAQE